MLLCWDKATLCMCVRGCRCGVAAGMRDLCLQCALLLETSKSKLSFPWAPHHLLGEGVSSKGAVVYLFVLLLPFGPIAANYNPNMQRPPHGPSSPLVTPKLLHDHKPLVPF